MRERYATHNPTKTAGRQRAFPEKERLSNQELNYNLFRKTRIHFFNFPQVLGNINACFYTKKTKQFIYTLVGFLQGMNSVILEIKSNAVAIINKRQISVTHPNYSVSILAKDIISFTIFVFTSIML